MAEYLYLEVSDGIELAYLVLGHANEPCKAAILLHGFTGLGVSWIGVAQELGKSRLLILPDLLGHGASSTPENASYYRIETTAAYLERLVNHTIGGPVHILGYSMGGRLALYFALKYPEMVRSLVLESASPGLQSENEREARRASDELLADRILAEGIEPFVNYWETLPLFASQSSLPPGILLSQRQLRLANNPVGLAGSLRGMGTGAQPSQWEHLSKISCPVLLIAGELDPKFLGINQRMMEKLPGATLKLIPGAGHTTHLEQPFLFSQQVLEFWNGLLSNKDQLHP